VPVPWSIKVQLHPGLIYCGKVIVPKFKNEEAFLAQGLHEPLISETMFFNIQDILNGRKRELGQPISTPEALVLRGFLKCPKCHGSLSGSSSKGKRRHFTYYHCTSACGIRFRSEKVNEAFALELLSYLPRKGYEEIFVETIADAYQNQVGSILDERKSYTKQIQELNKKIEKARDLLLDNDIDAVDFRAIKNECSEKISIVESKLSELNTKNKAALNIRPIAERAIKNLTDLDLFYENSSVEGKRYLVSCLFPEKMEYDGDRYPTLLVNEIAEHIYLKNKELGAKKMGQKFSKKSLPHWGSAKVRISNKFIADLKRIAELDTKMTEYDELGRLMKLRKESEKLIPKVVDKKKKIRAKRKARRVTLKKWILNISED